VHHAFSRKIEHPAKTSAVDSISVSVGISFCCIWLPSTGRPEDCFWEHLLKRQLWPLRVTMLNTCVRDVMVAGVL
jgi:hypothetical protein